MFRRKVYSQLAEWKRLSNGRTAALVEGARRIGKSTVVEAFAKAEYADYLLLDFSIEGTDIKRNFEENIGDLDTFFRNLFLLKGKSLPKGNAVIVFDEVQLFPLARQSIKQLVKDGRYHYIETGSLISIKKNVKDILIPSEEHRLRMYPMDFEEFLWAKGDEVTVPAIYAARKARKPLGDAAHRKIMRDFRSYLAVGGMPQAVAAYVEGRTFEEIDYEKRAIISLYEDDLKKYDGEGFGRVSAIFKSIPDQLAHHNCHFKLSTVDKSARYDQVIDSLEFMSESMIVNTCVNVTAPDVMLALYADKTNFKMFLGDTGLLVTQLASATNKTDESLYKALIFDKLGNNQGMIMENMVAQMMVASGRSLFFHEYKFTPEGSSREKKYEIDFLTVQEKHLLPVEVKSSGYRAHKSLDYFSEKYHVKLGEKIVLHTKDVARDGQVTYLPLYMAMCL